MQFRAAAFKSATMGLAGPGPTLTRNNGCGPRAAGGLGWGPGPEAAICVITARARVGPRVVAGRAGKPAAAVRTDSAAQAGRPPPARRRAEGPSPLLIAGGLGGRWVRKGGAGQSLAAHRAIARFCAFEEAVCWG